MRKGLAGRKVLITAGPTREPLDPIRFLTNASTGLMGFEMAREAKRRGARVTVVAGPNSLPWPRGVRVVRVETARQMFSAVLREAASADAFIASAAVSDWRPAAPSPVKIKRRASRDGTFTLRLIANPDILREVSDRRSRRRASRPVLVGFALETGPLLREARRKLREKSLDLIVANPVSALAAPRAKTLFVTAGGSVSRYGTAAKRAVANRVIGFLERRLSSGPHQ